MKNSQLAVLCAVILLAALIIVGGNYTLIKGLAKGIARVLRCHPWHPGGYDPP